MLRPVTLLLLASASLGCGSEDAAPSPKNDGHAGGGGSDVATDIGAVLICGGGHLPLEDGTCLAPGIAMGDCADGFVADGASGCLPVLPAEPCPEGLMAVPGDAECREVYPCGTEPFGGVPSEAGTQHVDPSYAGDVSDGGLATPHKTVGAALAAASPGAIVALAPGTYEAVTLDQPVRIWGKCPSQVILAATSGAALRINAGATGSEVHRVSLVADGIGLRVVGATEVRGEQLHIHDTGSRGGRVEGAGELTVVGSLVEGTHREGLTARGSTLRIEGTQVREPLPATGDDWAIGVRGATEGEAPASVTLTGSRVTGAQGVGLLATGADVVVERSVISDTHSLGTEGTEGVGIEVSRDEQVDRRSSLVLRDSVVARSSRYGIRADSTDVTIERSMILDTAFEPGTGEDGYGLFASFDLEPPPRVTVTQSVVERAFVAGIRGDSVDMTVVSTIVRDISPGAATGLNGEGIWVRPRYSTDVPSALTVRGCLVERTHGVGLWVAGSDGLVEHSLVADLGGGVLGAGAGIVFGIHKESGLLASGTVRQTEVRRALGVGLAALGAAVLAEHVVVSDTATTEGIGDFGDALIVSALDPVEMTSYPASLNVAHATLEGAARVGYASFSAKARLANSLLECNEIDLNTESLVEDVDAAFENGQGNQCGCDGERHVCKIVSSGLAPPIVPQ